MTVVNLIIGLAVGGVTGFLYAYYQMYKEQNEK